MDNRYLFRGKRIDNGEWIEGNLLHPLNPETQGYYIVPVGYALHRMTEVNPATVGQCTGLKDKNDRLIFEGDIVNMHYFFENYHPATLGAFEDEIEIQGRLECDELGLMLVDKKGAQYRMSEYVQEPSEEFEIIGNIHDSPEMLATSGEQKEEA